MLKKYEAKGLTLIAVPSNDFGEQAPHSSDCEREILYYKMGMSNFPVLDKAEIIGEKAVTYYKFLQHKKQEAEGGVLDSINLVGRAPWDISWNYEKFLVNQNGDVIGRYTHKVDVKDLEGQIQTILG